VQRLHEKFRGLEYFLAATVLLLTLSSSAYAGDEGLKAGNISFKVAGAVVVIFYDLTAPADQLYKVTLTLKRRFDPTFSYTPTNISGDVGPSVVPGDNRAITWRFGNEYPKGLPGEDCFFVVDVEVGSAAPQGISPVIWIAGGAAEAGGTLAETPSG